MTVQFDCPIDEEYQNYTGDPDLNSQSDYCLNFDIQWPIGVPLPRTGDKINIDNILIGLADDVDKVYRGRIWDVSWISHDVSTNAADYFVTIFLEKGEK